MKEFEEFLEQEGFVKNNGQYKKVIETAAGFESTVSIILYQPRKTVWMILDTNDRFGIKYRGRIRTIEFLRDLLKQVKYKDEEKDRILV